jgi:hypothetical protein
LGTGLGAIPLGSKTAFQDLVGGFVILTTTSFALTFVPHILTGRRNIPPGPFSLGHRWGLLINIAAVLLICFFNIMYCLRKSTYYVYGILYRIITNSFSSILFTDRCDDNEL